MPEILVLDIDNTLIEPMHTLQKRSEEALRRWIQAGNHLVFASGKNACAFEELIEKLQMKEGWHIAGNGGILSDPVHHQTEVLSVVGNRSQLCLEKLHELGIRVFSYTLDCIQITEEMPQDQIDYLRFLQDPPVCKVRTVDHEQVVKLLMFIHETQTELEQKVKEALDLESMGLQWMRTGEKLLEIHDLHQTKAEGLEKLCEKLGVKMEDVYAVGDSENDRSMLEAAGHPYLVANAAESMKHSGWPMLASCHDQGVADLIDQLLQEKA